MEEIVGADRPIDARHRLAAATRTIIDELVRSTAPDAELEAAATLVEQAIAGLAGRTHGRNYEGAAEGSLARLATLGRRSRSLEESHGFVEFSPFMGLLNPLAPPLELRVGTAEVVATATYGSAYEGPPGCLHGGFIAAGFDEVLGFAQALSGQTGMTGRLEVSYRSPTPLHREVRYVGRYERTEGRKVFTHATLSAGDTLCAEASGVFIAIKPGVFERLLQIRLGEAQPEDASGGGEASPA